MGAISQGYSDAFRRDQAPPTGTTPAAKNRLRRRAISTPRSLAQALTAGPWLRRRDGQGEEGSRQAPAAPYAAGRRSEQS